MNISPLSTLYEIILDVAGRGGVVPQLRFSDKCHNKLMEDISKLVITEARRRYPDQILRKVPIVVYGTNYRVVGYPEYMRRTFIDELVVNFIKEKRPFDERGNVIYECHILTEAEKEARRIQHWEAKHPGQKFEVKTAPKVPIAELPIRYTIKKRPAQVVAV